MKKLHTLNLSIWLPFTVTLLLFILLLLDINNSYHHHIEQVEKTAESHIHDTTFELSHFINHSLANDDVENIRNTITSAPLNEGIEYAIIVQQTTGEILFSSKLAWEKRNIKDIFAQGLPISLAPSHDAHQYHTYKTENTIEASAQLLTVTQGDLTLFVVYDMEPAIDQVLHHLVDDLIIKIIATSLVILILLFYIFRHVNQPLAQLQALAIRIREHQTNIENPLQGQNSLVTVGDTLSEMGQKLHDDLKLLAEKESRLNITLDSIADGVIVTDEKGYIKRLNPTAEMMTGYEEQDALNVAVSEVFKVRDENGDSLSPVYDVISTLMCVELHNKTQLISMDGTVFNIFQTASPIMDGDKLIGVILVFHNVTNEYQLREKLRENVSFLENLLYVSPSITFILKPTTSNHTQFEFTYISQSIFRYTGISAESWLEDKDKWYSRIPPDDIKNIRACLTTVMRSPGEAISTSFLFHLDNEIYLHFQVQFIANTQSANKVQIVGVATDITKQKQSEERVNFLAYHDVLTNLPNRAMLDEELMQAISRSHRKQEKFAVLFLDLDRFKVINDSLGHAIGDQLLVKVSKRILQQVRTEDTVARAGGDEFTIILLDTDSNGAAHVAQKILETVASPYHIDQHTLHVTVSIGISVYPENGDSVKLLKQKADNAMYRAKESERNMYQFFTEEMHDQMLQRMHLESQLHMAIERNELSMVYQPQLDIHTNKIIGAEALIRWNHTQLGFVSPAMFIPIAEESGQIEHIGEWVLNQSLAQLEQWKPSFKSPFTLAINLSAVQFRNARLTEHIITLLNQYNLGTQDIELEITESTAVEDVNHTIKQMKTMALAGIRLSLDDFGTGFSSLNSLKRFPINKLKVDKSFVDEMLTDKDDEAIVDAILKLADILEMTTLAEGVETQAQLNALQKKGCNAIQGYLFSRPLPPEDFLVFLTDYSDKTA